MERRTILKGLAATAAASAVIGPDFFRSAYAATAAGDGPFGPPTVDTGLGFLVPDGFSARVIAVGNEEVPGTGYTWHPASDGAGTFATDDGGWILVSNSESGAATGGASAIVFGPPGIDGVAPITDAYRVLGEPVGTTSGFNCAGGVTPWGTWFSAEENGGAMHVWECDPTGQTAAIELPMLGTFQHEAAVVDPYTGIVYLTEDSGDSRFFRWVPDVIPPFGTRPDFDNGRLQVAGFGSPHGSLAEGPATWIDVDAFDTGTYKASGSTSFIRGEGIWYHDRIVYWVASTLSQIYAYDTVTDEQVILHDPTVVSSPLNDADNLCVHANTADLYITEDPNAAPGIDVCVITAPDDNGDRVVAPVIRVPQGEHAGSELTGPVFDPSGTRFYFSSQRQVSPTDATNAAAGVIYEVTGPFNRFDTAAQDTTTSTTSLTTTTTTRPAAAPTTTAALPATGGGSAGAVLGGVAVVGAAAAHRLRRRAEPGR